MLKVNNNEPKDEVNNRIDKVKKPYVQFSKKIVGLLIGNLIVIELFVMYMTYITRDTSSMPYLITGIAVTMATGVIWYLKNSEAEKKARIDAEVERMKFLGVIPKAFDTILSNSNENDIPDTYYKGTEGSDNIVTPDIPIIVSSSTSNNTMEYTNSDYLDDGSVG